MHGTYVTRTSSSIFATVSRSFTITTWSTVTSKVYVLITSDLTETPVDSHPFHNGQANILVNHSGWACLTDFGLSSIASLGYTESTTQGPRGCYRWTAPELLRLSMDQSNRPTKQSDIYAFAMVAIEV
jgi:ribosomal protein L31